jgi:hypothetical protein
MQIIEKPDIVDVVQAEGIDLKLRGRHFWGLCPLHSERTASFAVDPEKQRFKCYGCGVSGDSIGFIMKLKGLSFRDVLKYLNITGDFRKINRDPLEIKRRELIDIFKVWCCNYTKYLCEMLRLCNQINELVTPDNLGIKGLAEMYLMRDVYQYHLSILQGKDDALKLELYKGVLNGR